MAFNKKIVITALVGASWVGALALGGHVLLKYETTAGPVGNPLTSWPAASSLKQPTNQRTLVMFAHPHCPCTRASVEELAQIMAHAGGRANAYVFFVKPADAGLDWDDTDLRRTAAAIPGVNVLTDENGIEAGRFGAETSGHTLVFETNGALLFSGGITASRGHIGTNAGSTAVLAAVKHEAVGLGTTPVYGCRFEKRALATGEEPCLN
jgi:hypothetical protein